MRHAKLLLDTQAIRLCVFALVLWLVFVFCITFAVAEHVYSAFINHHNRFTLDVGTRLNPALREGDEAVFSELLDKQMFDAIMFANTPWWSRVIRAERGHTRFSVLREHVPSDFQTAVLFYDSDGNKLRKSADILRIWYDTEESWRLGEGRPSGNAFIVLGNDDASGQLRAMYINHQMSFGFNPVRVTGYFAGAEFRPFKFSYITNDLFFEAQSVYGQYVDSRRETEHLVRTGRLAWQVLFDNTAETDNELITIFGATPHFMSQAGTGGPVRFRGTVYYDLLDLLRQAGRQDYLRNERLHYVGFISHDLGVFTLREIIMFGSWTFKDWESDGSEPSFSMLTAISSRPLSHAIRELRDVYIATFLITAFGVLILSRNIRWRESN